MKALADDDAAAAKAMEAMAAESIFIWCCVLGKKMLSDQEGGRARSNSEGARGCVDEASESSFKKGVIVDKSKVSCKSPQNH